MDMFIELIFINSHIVHTHPVINNEELLTVLIILCNHKPIIVWLLSLCLVHCQQFHSCYIDFSIRPSTDTKIGSTMQRTPWKFIIIINDRYGKHDIMHANRMNIKYFRLNVSVCLSLSTFVRRAQFIFQKKIFFHCYRIRLLIQLVGSKPISIIIIHWFWF